MAFESVEQDPEALLSLFGRGAARVGERRREEAARMVAREKCMVDGS
jgi:hypothetical protein